MIFKPSAEYIPSDAGYCTLLIPKAITFRGEIIMQRDTQSFEPASCNHRQTSSGFSQLVNQMVYHLQPDGCHLQLFKGWLYHLVVYHLVRWYNHPSNQLLSRRSCCAPVARPIACTSSMRRSACTRPRTRQGKVIHTWNRIGK